MDTASEISARLPRLRARSIGRSAIPDYDTIRDPVIQWATTASDLGYDTDSAGTARPQIKIFSGDHSKDQLGGGEASLISASEQGQRALLGGRCTS